MASGGEGGDAFVLGAWIGAGAGATLMDFDPEEDQMLVVYDDSDGAPAPELALQRSADAPGLTEIRLGGALLAVLPDADVPPLEAIVLLGESAADLAGAA